jgi:uncharacterized integral membrane protein
MGTLFFVILLFALVVVFSVQNALPVAVTFLLWKFEASLAVIIFLSLLTGMIIGAVIAFWTRRRRRPSQSPSRVTDGRAGTDASPNDIDKE